jgi:hypothetical protein
MAEAFLDLLRQRFPEAEGLAFRRIFARGHTIFFEKGPRRRLLPQFTEELVFAALILAKTYVAQAGAELILTEAEERIFKGYLVPIPKRQ